MAPLAWILLFATYVLRARMALGRWPAPYRPDPHALGFHIHHVVVLLGWPCALVFALVSFIAAWLPWPARLSLRESLSVGAVAMLSVTAALVLARSNPWHLVAWFLD